MADIGITAATGLLAARRKCVKAGSLSLMKRRSEDDAKTEVGRSNRIASFYNTEQPSVNHNNLHPSSREFA